MYTYTVCNKEHVLRATSYSSYYVLGGIYIYMNHVRYDTYFIMCV